MDARSLKFVSEACGGELRQGTPGAEVGGISTDSRTAGPGDLFVALAGDRFDGHDFLAAVAARGVAGVMGMRERLPKFPAGLGVVAVEDTRVALGRLASRYRQDFGLPVVAVGGSNGKTTTKELLGSVLRQRFKTVWSEASFNNDIGVPLTLMKIGSETQAAVLEAGTNHPGELAPLLRMINPRLGVITSIGREHLEFFGDLAGVAAEEGAMAEALPPDGVLFLDGDGEWTPAVAKRSAARVVRVGLSAANNFRASEVGMDESGLRFKASGLGLDGDYRINLVGRHQVVNAMLAIAVGGELGLDRAAIQRGLTEATPAKMRLRLWSQEGVRVLDDAYNANVESVRAALQTLKDLACDGRRIAVLGDMAELGGQSETCHAEAGGQAATLGIDVLVAVGKFRSVTASAARRGGLLEVVEIESVEAAAAAVKKLARRDDLILLKASRASRFERIAETLGGGAPGKK